MEYIAIIHKEPDSIFGVSFPDFVGCIAAGSTLEKARRDAVEALRIHIAGLLEDGEALPVPSSLDAVMAQPDFQDGVAFIVDTPVQDEVVRINATVLKSELVMIDALARQRGMTRSAFLVKSALNQI